MKILLWAAVLGVLLGGCLLIHNFMSLEKQRTDSLKSITDKADKIVVEKQHRKMYLLSDGKILREYKIDLGWNPKGDKEKEGDGRTPEGVYKISYKNPKSKYFLSLRISYPNAVDKAEAEAKGFNPGSDIMIHGLPNLLTILGFNQKLKSDWTQGCIAVQNNEDMKEIWSMVEVGTVVEIKP